MGGWCDFGQRGVARNSKVAGEALIVLLCCISLIDSEWPWMAINHVGNLGNGGSLGVGLSQNIKNI